MNVSGVYISGVVLVFDGWFSIVGIFYNLWFYLIKLAWPD
ncbi:hypothetical protein FLA_0436 [Filimonas lacunae]|nr:hypothetical protein FLA_0436 [Filimonas lacunae]